MARYITNQMSLLVLLLEIGETITGTPMNEFTSGDITNRGKILLFKQINA